MSRYITPPESLSFPDLEKETRKMPMQTNRELVGLAFMTTMLDTPIQRPCIHIHIALFLRSYSLQILREETDAGGK